ncbi:DUF938 domain-containing protein [Solemya velesiana gill symbiont]|uniref:Methylase n=1 Tax=Solemya velesiana gill symbiont TaxID=1918948 RepID=A0A1T2KVZ2_9GAMM|nr:DUF938 domain-containing protein [Solemya velesiana gill symbiont]OOZ36910.1 methylase [Solemya velesiana gill symbiont]
MTQATRKPHAEACDENGPPILAVLKARLPTNARVLEIGSGTGQHAVHFGAELPGITWQTSDQLDMHEGIQLWLDEAALPNVQPPLDLDVTCDQWPEAQYDAVFSANTAHIMPMEAVEAMFRGVGKRLNAGGQFLIYGPFMYHGEHTSESNRRFDQWLRTCEPHRGIRDVDWLEEIAAESGLRLEEDIEMPVNNRILVWTKTKP